MEATAIPQATTNNGKTTAANAVKSAGSVLHTGVYAIAEGIKYATAFAVNAIDSTQSKEDVRAELQAKTELRMATLEDKIASMKAKANQTK
jgi:hypothetical protein